MLVRAASNDTFALQATLANNTSKGIKHVGVLVDALEYEFDVPLAAGETRRGLIGREFTQPYDNDLKHKNHVVALLSGLPTITPVKPANLGNVGCWARSVIYDDGTVWSVSPI